jgi:hypothetical protein
MDEACGACATLLQNCLPQYDEQSEKPKALDRRLDCCRRVICGSCIAINPRFATYCIAPLHNPESFNNLQTQVHSAKSLQHLHLFPKACEIPQHTHLSPPPFEPHRSLTTISPPTPLSQSNKHPHQKNLNSQKMSSTSSTIHPTHS